VVRVLVFIRFGAWLLILGKATTSANVANAIHYYTSLWEEHNKWECDSIGSNSLATGRGLRLPISCGACGSTQNISSQPHILGSDV